MIRVAGVDQPDNLVAASAAFGGLLLTSTLVPFYHDTTTATCLRRPSTAQQNPSCGRPRVSHRLRLAHALAANCTTPQRRPHRRQRAQRDVRIAWGGDQARRLEAIFAPWSHEAVRKTPFVIVIGVLKRCSAVADHVHVHTNRHSHN